MPQPSPSNTLAPEDHALRMARLAHFVKASALSDSGAGLVGAGTGAAIGGLGAYLFNKYLKNNYNSGDPEKNDSPGADVALGALLGAGVGGGAGYLGHRFAVGKPFIQDPMTAKSTTGQTGAQIQDQINREGPLPGVVPSAVTGGVGAYAGTKAWQWMGWTDLAKERAGYWHNFKGAKNNWADAFKAHYPGGINDMLTQMKANLGENHPVVQRIQAAMTKLGPKPAVDPAAQAQATADFQGRQASAKSKLNMLMQRLEDFYQGDAAKSDLNVESVDPLYPQGLPNDIGPEVHANQISARMKALQASNALLHDPAYGEAVRPLSMNRTGPEIQQILRRLESRMNAKPPEALQISPEEVAAWERSHAAEGGGLMRGRYNETAGEMEGQARLHGWGGVAAGATLPWAFNKAYNYFYPPAQGSQANRQ